MSAAVVSRLSYRALLTRLEPVRSLCRSSDLGLLLSWHYPLSAPPLFNRSRVHSQQLRGVTFGPSVPTDCSCSAPVVSHHLDGFLRATAAGLLHPAASLEVRYVFRLPVPIPHPKMSNSHYGPVPAARFIPFKGFPSSAAVPHHCGRCPLTVGRRSPRSRLGSNRSRNRLARSTEVLHRSLRRPSRSRSCEPAPSEERTARHELSRGRSRYSSETLSEEMACPALAPTEADASTSPSHRGAGGSKIRAS